MRSILGVALAASACSLVVDLSPLAGPDAGIDAAPPDAASSACPSLHGPAMVEASGVCIDSTLVTKSMYAEFLGANASVKTDGPCAWHTTYVPQASSVLNVSYATEPDDAPVIGVDWCDARDYCAWAGKQLCGGLDGGATAYQSPASIDSQYARVCSQVGLFSVPYGAATGDTHTAGYCNLSAADGGPVPAKTFPLCEVGDSGIYDMLGNAFVWTNACDEPGAPYLDAGVTVAEAGYPNGYCGMVAGDWMQPYEFTSCNSVWNMDRASQAYFGSSSIRCCSVPR